MIAECPVCGAEFELDDDTEVNEIIKCFDCESELEVVSLDPPTLAETNEDIGK